MYQVNKISYPELQNYINVLEILKTTDFSNFTDEAIYNKYFDHALALPRLGGNIAFPKSLNQKFYRVRLSTNIGSKDNLFSTKTFSYPPPKFCNKKGRANLVNKPVFYCTDQAFPAIRECNAQIGIDGYLSIWKVNPEMKIHYATCLSEKLPDSNQWKEYGTYHHDFLISHQQVNDLSLVEYKVALRNFITDRFMKEHYPYHISSLIAHEYLYYSNVEVLLYPSAQTFQNYTNFAFHPRSVDQYLHCEKVLHFKIVKEIDNQFELNINLIGIVDNHIIKWRKPSDMELEELGFKKLN